MTHSQIARAYGVNSTSIRQIVLNRTYLTPEQNNNHTINVRESYWPTYYTPAPNLDPHAQARTHEIRTSYDHATHPDYLTQVADARRRWGES